MKILKWIDSYVDSFEKRVFLFTCFITLYWLWQNIWQFLMLIQLLKIQDYSDLFAFQSNMSMYESSVFIRILYSVISNPNSIVSCIKLIDIFGIFSLLICIKKYRKIIGLFGVKYVWCIFWVLKGVHSNSLNNVILSLKMLAIGGIVVVGIVILLFLHELICDILDWKKTVYKS